MNLCTRPTFSLLHPTARVHAYPSFPRGWMDVCEAYYALCDNPEDVEYVLAVHASRWEEFQNGPLGPPAFPKWGAVRVVRNEGRDTCVDQINVAAAASDGLVLHGVMDDMYPPAHWDTVIRKALPALDKPYALHCSSGSARDSQLMIAGALTRARYQQVGFCLPPQFESMCADDYMMDLHKRAGCVIDRPDIRFEHRHPAFGTAEQDEIYALQNRPEAYQAGAELLRASRLDARSLAFATLGERFSWAWVSWWNILIEHVFQRGFQCAWPPYAGYDSNVYNARGSLCSAILEHSPVPDFVLWLDDDNVISPGQFDRLITDLDARPDLDMVAGWTFCGADGFASDYRASVGRMRDPGIAVPLGPDELCGGAGLVDIDWTGFPVVLMRGETLRKAGPFPFDPLMGGPSRFWGEDLSFCARLKAAGGRIAVDSEVMVPHFKLRPYVPAEVLVSMRSGSAALSGPGKV